MLILSRVSVEIEAGKGARDSTTPASFHGKEGKKASPACACFPVTSGHRESCSRLIPRVKMQCSLTFWLQRHYSQRPALDGLGRDEPRCCGVFDCDHSRSPAAVGALGYATRSAAASALLLLLQYQRRRLRPNSFSVCACFCCCCCWRQLDNAFLLFPLLSS